MSKYSAFNRHEYMQHAELVSKGNHVPRYQTCGIPKGANLKDAVALAYGRPLGNEAWLPVNDGS